MITKFSELKKYQKTKHAANEIESGCSKVMDLLLNNDIHGIGCVIAFVRVDGEEYEYKTYAINTENGKYILTHHDHTYDRAVRAAASMLAHDRIIPLENLNWFLFSY